MHRVRHRRARGRGVAALDAFGLLSGGDRAPGLGDAGDQAVQLDDGVAVRKRCVGLQLRQGKAIARERVEKPAVDIVDARTLGGVACGLRDTDLFVEDDLQDQPVLCRTRRFDLDMVVPLQHVLDPWRGACVERGLGRRLAHQLGIGRERTQRDRNDRLRDAVGVVPVFALQAKRGGQGIGPRVALVAIVRQNKAQPG